MRNPQSRLLTLLALTLAHGRKWSPFHPFRGRGWRRSQNGVGHKMRREKRRKKGEKEKKEERKMEKRKRKNEKERKKKRKRERERERESRRNSEAFYRLIEALQVSLRPSEAH